MELRKVRKDEPEFTRRFDGSSFHNATFKASVNELTALFGEENVGASSDEKIKHEWFMLIRNSKIRIFFHIYDWKEYRNYPNDEIIEWHIGSIHEEYVDVQIAKAISNLLYDLRTRGK